MSRVNDELESITRRNKIVWEQTYRLSDAYKTSPGKIIGQFSNDDLKKLDHLIEAKKNIIKPKIVKVINVDPMEVAKAVAEKGVIPLVVNSGSQNDPLKIIETGPVGPEWDLLRRSNICNSIVPDTMYPISQDKNLYFPNVTVFRSETYDSLKKTFKIAVITSIPVSSPGIIQTQNNGKITESYENNRDHDRMYERIERIFEIAILKRHNCIIFNDFGIPQNNPIGAVIDMFNKAIAKYPIRYVFFAIQEPLLDRLKRRKAQKDYKPYILFHAKINRQTYL